GESRFSESAPSCLLLNIFHENSCSFIFYPLNLNNLDVISVFLCIEPVRKHICGSLGDILLFLWFYDSKVLKTE
ncbi:hypothetical protein, partial [Prevotella sp.]|uniref:hypothetical protein n=1 Tax=Prevotella sp. TaxID=59823 RepID=UPI003077C97C